ncbi:MAG: methylmalonyl Co-A mutase-associated GTPase MeaB, partial [Pseudomonadota bacterium]
PHTGRAMIVGVTGSGGSGKSTLIDHLIGRFRRMDKKVGVAAVDPSSPFSGGALLGDRLRMRDIATDPAIFIRSMATRGALGGLCQGARDVARILDAFGKDVVLIETVGVGQDEVEVVKAADMVAVVCVPGQGDGVQALKAGIMEIADVYVVNKADRPGVEEVEADIRGMLSLASRPGVPDPPVIQTSALSGTGVSEFTDLVAGGCVSSRNRDTWMARRVREEVLSLLSSEILDALTSKWGNNGKLDRAVAGIMARTRDPYSVVDELLPEARKLFGNGRMEQEEEA